MEEEEGAGGRLSAQPPALPPQRTFSTQQSELFVKTAIRAFELSSNSTRRKEKEKERENGGRERAKTGGIYQTGEKRRRRVFDFLNPPEKEEREGLKAVFLRCVCVCECVWGLGGWGLCCGIVASYRFCVECVKIIQ